MQFRATLLPSHPGPQREVKHPTIGDGRGDGLQTAGYAREVTSPDPQTPQGAGL